MFSTPIPLFTLKMSSLDIFASPTAQAISFPSACIASAFSAPNGAAKSAPFDVRPGLYGSVREGGMKLQEQTDHMMLAPARTNLMAPLST